MDMCIGFKTITLRKKKEKKRVGWLTVTIDPPIFCSGIAEHDRNDYYS